MQQHTTKSMPSTAAPFPPHACRGLTAHQAARFLQLQRLQSARHQLPASVSSDFDDGDEAAAAAAVSQDTPVDSHPISVSPVSRGSRCRCPWAQAATTSIWQQHATGVLFCVVLTGCCLLQVPSSRRPSSNGSRDVIRAVQGLPGLPSRSGQHALLHDTSRPWACLVVRSRRTHISSRQMQNSFTSTSQTPQHACRRVLCHHVVQVPSLARPAGAAVTAASRAARHRLTS